MAAAAEAGLLIVILGARSARAQTPEDRGADRRDLYVRLGGGVGYTSGSYTFSGMSEPAFGPVVPLTFETTLHGAHGEVEVAVGNAVGAGFAVAGVAGGRLVPPGPDREMLGATRINGAVLGKVGLLLDLFPLPLEQAHFALGAGWSAASFFWEQNGIGSPDNIVDPESVSGPYAEAGAGYRLTPRFDLLARVSYAWLEGTQSTYRPLGVTVLASWLHF